MNILRKVLDYRDIKNKVYIPQGECVKDESKEIVYHSKGFRLRFYDNNYTNVLKCKRFFFSCSSIF